MHCIEFTAAARELSLFRLATWAQQNIRLMMHTALLVFVPVIAARLG